MARSRRRGGPVWIIPVADAHPHPWPPAQDLEALGVAPDVVQIYRALRFLHSPAGLLRTLADRRN